MRKILPMVVLASISLMLVMASGMIGCAEEEETKELVAPEIEIIDFSRDATIVPADPNDMAAQTVVMDMVLKISNPNDFQVCAESFLMRVYVADVKVDDPNYFDKLYVPGTESVTFHRRFVFQPMNVIIDLMGQGMSFMEAMGPALLIWNEVTQDTATWDLECRARITSEGGDLDKTYNLSWTKPS